MDSCSGPVLLDRVVCELPIITGRRDRSGKIGPATGLHPTAATPFAAWWWQRAAPTEVASHL